MRLVYDYVIAIVMQYTWTKSRLWRKGRGETSVQNCHGTDLNRNFNVHWAEVIIL